MSRRTRRCTSFAKPTGARRSSIIPTWEARSGRSDPRTVVRSAQYRARRAGDSSRIPGSSGRVRPGCRSQGRQGGAPHATAQPGCVGFRALRGRAKGRSESVRQGVHDPSADPAKVVNVEQLWVRFEVDQLWLLQDGSREDRFLSCSLNVSWPEPELASRAATIPDAEAILRDLSEVFEQIHIGTPVINSRCKVEDHKFQGWLSYPNTQLASGAFNKLHKELNARGLSVTQWTRDLIIPREWR